MFVGLSGGPLGLVVFEDEGFKGEAESIMYPYRPLPHLTASHRGRDEDQASCEQVEFSRTQSTHGFAGTRGRKKASEKLTAAHSGSNALRIAEDAPVAVYHLPRAFEELRELEGAA